MYLLSTINTDRLLSLTASEEIATFEVENLQDPLPTARWRSTGLTPYVVGQFAEAVTIDFWGAWYVNARAGDQARLRLASSQGGLTAAPDLDTGMLDVQPGTANLDDWFGPGQLGYVHQRSKIAAADQVSGTWFRIDFDFTGNSDGYVQAGALFLATMLEPTRGAEPGWEYRPVNRGMHEVSYAAGGTGRGGGGQRRDVVFKIRRMTEANASGVINPLLRERAGVLPVGIVLDESDDYPMDHMFFGYLDARAVPNTFLRNYSLDAQITEP